MDSRQEVVGVVRFLTEAFRIVREDGGWPELEVREVYSGPDPAAAVVAAENARAEDWDFLITSERVEVVS